MSPELEAELFDRRPELNPQTKRYNLRRAESLAERSQERFHCQDLIEGGYGAKEVQSIECLKAELSLMDRLD